MRARPNPLAVAVVLSLVNGASICAAFAAPHAFAEIREAVALFGAVFLAHPIALVSWTMSRASSYEGGVRIPAWLMPSGSLVGMLARAMIPVTCPAPDYRNSIEYSRSKPPLIAAALAAAMAAPIAWFAFALASLPVIRTLHRARWTPSDEARDDAYATLGLWPLPFILVVAPVVFAFEGNVAWLALPITLCLSLAILGAVRRSRRRTLLAAILRGDHPRWRVLDPAPTLDLPWWLRAPSCETIAIAPRPSDADGYRDDSGRLAPIALASIVRINGALHVPDEGRSLLATLRALVDQRTAAP